ncbi:MAG: tetratricopeptide repeat protein, partial [Anaerolineae bacterium]|nr:tetratricopeptide repeat protein [Anaerolineae bacterium]
MPDSTPSFDSQGGVNISGGSATSGRDIVGGNVIYNIGVGGPPPNSPPDAGAALADSPRIWNVPHNRNPNLVGRTGELEQMRSSFGVGDLADIAERAHIAQPVGWAPLGRKQIVALTQAITGLGGIGKTSLAVEYCFQYRDVYDIVWWLRAEDRATLATDYAALAPKLNPALAGVADVPALVEWVRDYLRQHGRWLLVMDNANHPDEVRAYLPPVGKGHVLITSRDPGWDEIGASIKLATLPRADSIRLLTEQSGDADIASADALAARLGDLPLALEHARAYLRQNSITLAVYLELFKTRHADLWKNSTKPQNYHATVATTWDISFEQIAAQSLAAADLLNLIAFFAPDDIPLDVIKAYKGYLPEPLAGTVVDPLALNAAIATLLGYSLVERRGDNLFAHRLVQTVTRDRLDDARRKRWAQTAVQIVNDAFPGDVQTNVEGWATCARLLPHGLEATAHAETENVAPEQTARLFNQMGLYAQSRAQFTEGKELYKRALAIDEKQFGPDHPNVAIDVNNIGSVLQDLGDMAGAKAYLERALAIDEKQSGPDHPDVAIDVNNLGMVLKELGDMAGARAHYERALAIDEKQFGLDHPNVAIRVNNLGMVLKELGDMAGARAHYERALA